MSKSNYYLNLDDPKYFVDINQRKEFMQYNINEKSYPPFNIPDDAESELHRSGVHLDLHPAQSLVMNIMNPNTNSNRLLIKWDPGMGKTVVACSIAMYYLQMISMKLKTSENLNSFVYVIGFSETIFRDELLKFPEFGFINREELETLNEYKAKRYASKIDGNKYSEYHSQLNSRLTNKKGYGFFKFHGYRAFINRIFLYDESKIENILDMDEHKIR